MITFSVPSNSSLDIFFILFCQTQDGTLHWGQKADIIASGILDSTFRSSGLRFDPVRGDFT